MQGDVTHETGFTGDLDKVLHSVPVLNYLDRPFADGLVSAIRLSRGNAHVDWAWPGITPGFRVRRLPPTTVVGSEY